MRLILILALGLGVAGAAHAQFQPIPPIPAIPGIPPIPGPKTPRMETFKPFEPPKLYTPPRLPSVYDDGPFSPAGEAKRERKANMPPPPGPFSPEGEAKRARREAKDFHPF